MKALLFLLLIYSPGLLGQTIYIVFTEFRYENNTLVDWDENCLYQFDYADNTRCEHKRLPKEDYYGNFEKGTEIILLLDSSRFANKNSVTLRCQFFTTHKASQTMIDEPKEYLIKHEDLVPISENVFKLKKPLLLTEPEMFSLVSMMNSIEKRLFRSAENKTKYPSIISEIQNFEEDYVFQRTISFERLMNYYELCQYLRDYTEPNSFFISEATKLKNEIERMNRELGNDSNNKDDNPHYNRLIKANKIYQEYQQLSGFMNTLYAKLKLTLFTRANK